MRLDIDTELYLRTLDISDAKRIFELVEENRSHLERWLPWVDGTTTVADSEAFLAHVEASHASHRGVHCAMVYQEQLVGLIGLRFEAGNHVANIGYWLHKKCTGKGVVTRSVKRLCQYGFDDLNLVRIEIRASTGNAPSRGIPERLGFTLEGVLRHCEKVGERFVDHCMYSLLYTDPVEWR